MTGDARAPLCNLKGEIQMSHTIDVLQRAIAKAMAHRPQVGGFPYLAQILKEAGVLRNEWHLPSCQSLYITLLGPVVMQGSPLVSGAINVQPFNETALIAALRADQVGKTDFPEFLFAVWQAGVIRYEVNFEARNVTYYGASGESYTEPYPSVVIENSPYN